MPDLKTLFAALENQPRLLIEAELKPVQGDRFQPTGFPDLGAATYKRPNSDGTFTSMLLVESAQSMANRLEKVCWDNVDDAIVSTLAGLPHVVVSYADGSKTSSIQEAHRLNSYYLFDTTDLKDKLASGLGKSLSGTLDIRKVAQSIFQFDVGSILHGVFFAKSNFFEGRARLQRLLSSFVEAEGTEVVASGGAKLDRFTSKGEANEEGKRGSEEGRGNIIYSRTEFAARKIRAFFNLDLATLRGYGLDKEFPGANELIISIALYKILRLLNEGLRLRTACDFAVHSLAATRPNALDLSGSDELLTELEAALPQMIRAMNFGAQPLELRGEFKKTKPKATEATEIAPDDAAEGNNQ